MNKRKQQQLTNRLVRDHKRRVEHFGRMTSKINYAIDATGLGDPCAQLLDKAKAAVTGPRRAAYGDPADDLQATADLWSTWLNRRHGTTLKLTGADVAIMMVLLKTTRLANTIDHTDSALDVAGYAACLHSCQVKAGAKPIE